jgi:hypothetical protein
MNSTTYANIEDKEWKCYGCQSVNCSSFLYHAFNLNVSNSFDPLAGIPGDDSIFFTQVPSPSAFQHPLAQSSPLVSGNDTTRLRSTITSSTSSIPTNASYSNTRADNIRIAVINANSVKNKKCEIAELCYSTNSDILVFTETKIDNTIASSEFLPKNYNGYIRKDRNTEGGGVLIAVKNSLVVDEVALESMNSEIVCARLTLHKSSPMYILAYYRPPDNVASVDGLEHALEDLSSLTKNNNKCCIIAAGDFNVGDIQWDTLSVKPSSTKKGVCKRVMDIISDFHLHQLQREPTRQDAILDLFCINKPGLVKSIQTIPGISDHDGIMLNLHPNF